MTDKQDPITHAARLLREAAEELRQAHAYSNSEGWENETDAKAAYDEHLAAAQALEDWEQAIGAGGVQALSAGPEAFLKGVIALCSHRGYSPANIEAWDKDDKWVADLWRQAEAMLAASPTPPAEQQAASSAVLKAIHEANMQLVRTGDDAFMLVPYKVATVEQQAAPKAAPGEQDDHQILAITTAYEQGVGKDHQAYNSGKEIANPYSPAYRCDLAWQYGYKEGKEQAQREAKAAPQQEAQEPVAWLNPWRADQVTTDYDAYGERGIPLYTAPQPAPGVGNSVFDHQTAADFLSGKTVSDEAVRKFVAASRWAHDERAALSATLLAMHGVLTSREAEIAHLKKALLEAEAAPQQEAQEPVAYVHVPHSTVEGKVRPVVSFEKYQQDYADGIYSTRIPLYAAPQPAPDCHHRPPCDECAALAAQGSKT